MNKKIIISVKIIIDFQQSIAVSANWFRIVDAKSILKLQMEFATF